jgi:hypothetical protein
MVFLALALILLFFSISAQEDEQHLGIFISKIVENSPASEKLQLYDRILQVYLRFSFAPCGSSPEITYQHCCLANLCHNSQISGNILCCIVKLVPFHIYSYFTVWGFLFIWRGPAFKHLNICVVYHLAIFGNDCIRHLIAFS